MKQKLVLLVTLFVLLATSTFCFSACNNGGLFHQHEYSTVIKKPTCTEQGFTRYTCTCGDSYTDNYVAAKGHDYDTWIDEKQATCTADGVLGHYHCDNCDKDFDENYNELEDLVITSRHSYTSVVTKPTCTEDGYTTYTCACGDNYIDDYVSAKGHKYNSVVTKPTCTEQGYTTYTCTCGDSYIDNYVDAKGHYYGTWIDEKKATCTTDGKLGHYHCYRCDKNFD